MTRLDSRRTPILERLFVGHHDLLAALRSLRRSPTFVAIAVLSLGLAIGLNTTTYALLDAIRNPYVPYAHAEELFTLRATVQGVDALPYVGDMERAMFGRADLYESIVPWASSRRFGVIEANGHVVNGSTKLVGTELFKVLGVEPEIGRAFDANAGEGEDDPPAVISYRLWREAYARDPHLDRMTVSVGASEHRVIGVMPPSMTYPVGTDVWLPMPRGAGTAAGASQVSAALIRLRPGDNPGRVRTQFKALTNRFVLDHPGNRSLFDYRVDPLTGVPGILGSFHYAMAGVSLLVLCIACLNLANLILARGLSRSREIAVRMALGGSRAAIMRYVLAECALLGAAGGLWGVMLSLWGIHISQYHMPPELAQVGLLDPHLSWRVLAFALGVTIATVLMSGIGPALRAQRANVSDAMKDGGANTSGRANRSYSALVVGEVALSLVVLMCAGLLLRSAYRVAHIPFGYDASHLYTAYVNPSAAVCPKDDSASTYMDNLAKRVAAVPGVRYAAVTTGLVTRRHLVTSDQAGEPIEAVLSGYSVVTPDYFRTYGIPITAGRDFEPGDARTSGAAIINWSLAKRLWPLQSPIGRSIKLGPSAMPAQWVRVVGIAGERPSAFRDTIVSGEPQLTVARGGGCRFALVIMRAADNDGKTPVAAFHELRAATPGGYASPLTPALADHRADLEARTLVALMFAAFGVFALTLSAVGIYGVLNYTVGQRIREFATRIALGAVPKDLLRIIMHDALVMVLAGTGIGAFGALAFGFLLDDHWLKGIGPTDVIALVSAEAVIVGVSLLACLGPAARAARADPVELLRAT